MGLMDKVKSQANQLAGIAQQAGQAGQAKIAEVQVKRKVDALLLELGGIVYLQRTGRADAAADARATELVGLVQTHEAEHGAIVVTSAKAPADTGTSEDRPTEGAPAEGAASAGASPGVSSTRSTSTEGTSTEGAPTEGAPTEGAPTEGASTGVAGRAVPTRPASKAAAPVGADDEG